jgi:3-(methylsulfanyl)propanoyl-CoA dehydrogenase
MSYRAPVADIAFTLKHAAGLKTALAEGIYGDLDEETVDSVLAEAGRYASDVIAPLNSVGDKFGTPFKDGKVTTPPGWKDAYTAWAAAGWNGLAAPADWGGQELPHAVNAACIEMWNSASMAFGIGPVLTMAAIDSLHAYGSDALKKEYLGKLISGEWMGTMQLTEPQAGSDVGALRSKAERASDGSYLITGSKIFITYGEHQGYFAVSRAENNAGWHTQRCACAFGGAQAGHPCLSHLYDGLWRSRRGRWLPDR